MLAGVVELVPRLTNVPISSAVCVCVLVHVLCLSLVSHVCLCVYVLVCALQRRTQL